MDGFGHTLANAPLILSIPRTSLWSLIFFNTLPVPLLLQPLPVNPFEQMSSPSALLLLLLLLMASTSAFLVPSPIVMPQRRMSSVRAAGLEIGEILPTLEPTLKVTRYGAKGGGGKASACERGGAGANDLYVLSAAMCMDSVLMSHFYPSALVIAMAGPSCSWSRWGRFDPHPKGLFTMVFIRGSKDTYSRPTLIMLFGIAETVCSVCISFPPHPPRSPSFPPSHHPASRWKILRPTPPSARIWWKLMSMDRMLKEPTTKR